MINNIKLVKIDKEYCRYLNNFDKRVSYNWKSKENRPYIGVLFEVNGCKYFAPLTSPKPKHLKMREMFDFIPLDHGKLGAVNFNNMIPVTMENVSILKLTKDEFKDEKYLILLIKQLRWLERNKDKLYNYSKRLYEMFLLDKLDVNVKNRCCNFTLLEEKCREYNKSKVNT